MRSRLDKEMQLRGLADSREKAQQLIAENLVLVDGVIASKASRKVSKQENILIKGGAPRFVSRAGYKLQFALETFNIDVKDKLCLDIGSSTGGFSDSLLQNGARRVVCVDVGKNQLHEKILDNPKIEAFQSTDIRKFNYSEKFDFICVDVSFISLTHISSSILEFITDDGHLLTLVKPQFEAGKDEVDKGRGVINNSEIWYRVLLNVIKDFISHGFKMLAVEPSPIKGAKGNVEFLVHFRKVKTD